MFFRSALLVAGAGLAVAQSTSNSCYSAILAVATSPDATCLDLTLLAPLALSNSSTSSVIPTINTWLTGMCSQGPCSNATLQAIVTNITAGCSGNLSSFGLPTNDTASAVTYLQEAYPTTREILCLEDTSANSLCTTELLTDIQSSTDTTLSITNIFGLITQSLFQENVTIPQNVTCSNCSKAAYTIAAQNFPTLINGEKSVVQSECGSSFTDGQMPSNIQETASNSTSSSSSSSSGAASLSISSINVGVVMLFVVLSAFTVLA